jgi:Tfp pilus assembly protein PilF
MRARALMIRGDYASACPLAEASKTLVLEGTQSMYKEFLVMPPLGDCAMNLGDHEGADKYFRRALKLRNEMGGDHHPWAAIQWADIAFNLSMAGRHQEAEAFLGGAPKLETGQQTIYATERVIPETLSRVRMNAGDVERARALLPAAERHPRYADSSRVFSFYELRGEIRCGSAEYAPGLLDLRRSIDSQLTISGPNHPWLARTRAVAGLCALAQGQRKSAEELADASRQAFVAQPNVSPYFKEPLVRLERQLGRKPS